MHQASLPDEKTDIKLLKCFLRTDKQPFSNRNYCHVYLQSRIDNNPYYNMTQKLVQNKFPCRFNSGGKVVKICTYNKCYDSPFICDLEGCNCNSLHRDCQDLISFELAVSSLMSKVAEGQSCLNSVITFCDSAINKLKQKREQFQNMVQAGGLLLGKSQKIFYNAIRRNNYENITSQVLHEYIEESRPQNYMNIDKLKIRIQHKMKASKQKIDCMLEELQELSKQMQGVKSLIKIKGVQIAQQLQKSNPFTEVYEKCGKQQFQEVKMRAPSMQHQAQQNEQDDGWDIIRQFDYKTPISSRKASYLIKIIEDFAAQKLFYSDEVFKLSDRMKNPLIRVYDRKRAVGNAIKYRDLVLVEPALKDLGNKDTITFGIQIIHQYQSVIGICFADSARKLQYRSKDLQNESKGIFAVTSKGYVISGCMNENGSHQDFVYSHGDTLLLQYDLRGKYIKIMNQKSRQMVKITVQNPENKDLHIMIALRCGGIFEPNNTIKFMGELIT